MSMSWSVNENRTVGQEQAVSVKALLSQAPFVVLGPQAGDGAGLGRIHAIKIRAALMAVLGRKAVAAWEREHRLRIVERQEDLPQAARRLAPGARISGYRDGTCAWLVAASVVPWQASGLLLHDLGFLSQISTGWRRMRLRLHVLRQRFTGWYPGKTLSAK